MTIETLKASAIVNTHNRPDYLARCLRCLAHQTIPHARYEIVVVDNSSSPHREENSRVVDGIVRENPGLALRYVYDHVNGGLTHSRNLAVSKAITNVIVQADDDSLPCPAYIATAIAALSHEDTAVIKGRMVAKYEEREPDPRLIGKLKKPAHGGYIVPDLTCIDLGAERVEIGPALAYGSNCAFKKDFYLKAGGFGPDGFAAPFLYWNGTGEYHYAKAAPQLGYKIWYDPGMFADHIIPANRLKAEFFFARSFYYGIGGSFDLVSRGYRPFSIAALTVLLWRVRLAAGHVWRSRSAAWPSAIPPP
jgi:GT2 family glycosyltransferase